MPYTMEQKWNTIQHGTEMEMVMVQKYKTKWTDIEIQNGTDIAIQKLNLNVIQHGTGMKIQHGTEM